MCIYCVGCFWINSSSEKCFQSDFEYLIKWRNWLLWISTWKPLTLLTEQLIRNLVFLDGDYNLRFFVVLPTF